MKVPAISFFALTVLEGLQSVNAAPSNPELNKRDAQFVNGQPIDANGKGGPILGTHARSKPWIELTQSSHVKVAQIMSLISRIPTI